MARFLISIVFGLLTCSAMAAQSTWHFSTDDINSLHSKPADHRLFYGTDPLQFGDLRLPNGKGPFPVAIVIHGGCWISDMADQQNTAALADAIRDQGIATWNLEYRGEDVNGGGWPGTFLDVASGADYLEKVADKYNLDLTRVMALGHSAGGHLALWLGGRNQISTDSPLYSEDPLALEEVVLLGGAPDLKAVRHLGDKVCGGDVVGKLLGGTSKEIQKHYHEASPKELLPLGVSQVLIVGSDDKAVPVEFVRGYVEAAQKEGDEVQLVEIDGAGHHEYNAPNSVTWPVIKSKVLALLD